MASFNPKGPYKNMVRPSACSIDIPWWQVACLMHLLLQTELWDGEVSEYNLKMVSKAVSWCAWCLPCLAR